MKYQHSIRNFIPKWNAFPWLILAILLLSGASQAQLWSGILNSTNGTDWTQAGVVGGIPSGSWTQCGTTISAYTGTAATINSAIAACGSNQFVLLGSGTFTLSTGIDFAHKSNVVLRGGGANTTFIVFGSSATVSGCDNGGSLICINPTDVTYWNSNTSYNWTGGYTQGSTGPLSVSSTTGISTGTFVAINQCDTGFSGAACGTGNATDNGNYYNCGTQYNATGPHGCSQSGPNSGNGSTLRFQTELHTVCSVSAGVSVTLCEPLVHPNWASGQTPQIWFVTPITNVGIENMSITGTGNTTALTMFDFFNAVNVWVSGVKAVNGNIATISFEDSLHFTVQNSYLWSTIAGDSHAIRRVVTSYGLIQNNICQQQIGCDVAEGDDNTTVIAYNFSVGNCNYNSPSTQCGGPTIGGDGLQNSYRVHSNGNDFKLLEGNVGTNYDADGNHGTALSTTLFRNFFPGWESCGFANTICGNTSAKDFLTNSVFLAGLQGRYHYFVGNVLGTPGYHTNYSYTASLDNHAIYGLGGQVGGVTPSDTLVKTTSMFWGNYDVATGAIRWCGNSSDTGWTTTCASTTEVPSGLSVFPNAVPTAGDTGAGQSALPASFYLSSKPSWFGSHVWPPIGPDVTGGNVGQCPGTLNVANKFNGAPASSSSQCAGSGLTSSAWAGHVNLIPAMDCYLNTMSGTADGTGSSPLAFDASLCYASGPSQASQPSCTPTSGVVPQTVTCTNPNSGTTVMSYTTDGSTPITNGLGTGTTHGTTYTTAITISVAGNLQIVAGTSTLTDSSAASYTYSPGAAPPGFSANTFVAYISEKVLSDLR